MKNDLELFQALINGETIELTERTKQNKRSNGYKGKFPSWKLIDNSLKDLMESGYSIVSFHKQDLQIKPRTIKIGEFEVSNPVKSVELDVVYYYPALSQDELYDTATWSNDCFDINRLSRGLIHLSKAAAILHAKALLSFTCKEV
jgi:hypothetical protein